MSGSGAATELAAHLAALEPARRREEAERLDAAFREATGWAPRLWPGGIVGYGRYRYRYASGREGASFATGFAARKANLAIHIMPGYADFSDILARLGKHRTGAACVYANRLEDIDLAVLAELVRAGLADLSRQFPVEPS